MKEVRIHSHILTCIKFKHFPINCVIIVSRHLDQLNNIKSTCPYQNIQSFIFIHFYYVFHITEVSREITGHTHRHQCHPCLLGIYALIRAFLPHAIGLVA